MENSLQIKIKAKVYAKIKIISDNQTINTNNAMQEIEDLVANCDFMIGIAETIERDEPYVKVVEKAENQPKIFRDEIR